MALYFSAEIPYENAEKEEVKSQFPENRIPK